MVVLIATGATFIYKLIRDERKHCSNCKFYKRNENSNIGKCSKTVFNDWKFNWEACKMWKSNNGKGGEENE